MNYSLLDAFLSWIDNGKRLAFAVGTLGIVIGVIYWLDKARYKRLDAEWAIQEAKWKAEYEANQARHEAIRAESQRLIDIQERCLSNSTRRRYSKQVRTLP